jgi:hypothetical protein
MNRTHIGLRVLLALYTLAALATLLYTVGAPHEGS